MKRFNKVRHIITDIIEPSRGKVISFFYELFMLFLVVFSIVPLMYRSGEGGEFIETLRNLNVMFLSLFIVDWVLRWATSDIRWPKQYAKYGWKQFLIYPFTIWSLIDLTTIIPSFFPGLAWFKSFRAIRIFKTARISPIIWSGITFVFRAVFRQWKAFIMVFVTLLFIIFIGSVILFQVEVEANDNINSFGDAIWFTFITITTIGYGDIYPVTLTGRIFAGTFAILGIINLALITGIAVTGFSLEIKDYQKAKEEGTLKIDTRKLVIQKKVSKTKKKIEKNLAIEEMLDNPKLDHQKKREKMLDNPKLNLQTKKKK